MDIRLMSSVYRKLPIKCTHGVMVNEFKIILLMLWVLR